ncbi:hypothetical protein RN001_000974 [Aquatica leii]|uniref:Uncharacterized protein n=1 Tax=Aquatica leii TaxID=1421715 RepID=A0AAN7QMC2_9COLE|nr:hypothetical protein RN001_000974 [Aquatica leii]
MRTKVDDAAEKATFSSLVPEKDRCVKKFNSIQEKEIRKVVSDWLSQAKHRKYKKEQRASRKLEQPIISTGGAEDINDMDI